MPVHKKAFRDQSKSEVDASSRAGGSAALGPQPTDVCASGASQKPIKISSHSISRLHFCILTTEHHFGCIDTISCVDALRPCTGGIIAIGQENIVRSRTTVATRLLPPSPITSFLSLYLSSISLTEDSHPTGLTKSKSYNRFQLLELTIITPPGWHLSVDTEARLILKPNIMRYGLSRVYILYGVS